MFSHACVETYLPAAGFVEGWPARAGLWHGWASDDPIPTSRTRGIAMQFRLATTLATNFLAGRISIQFECSSSWGTSAGLCSRFSPPLVERVY